MSHSNLFLISVLKVIFYFFHMCFGIQVLSPFHLDIKTIPLMNSNSPKTYKTQTWLSSHLISWSQCELSRTSITVYMLWMQHKLSFDFHIAFDIHIVGTQPLPKFGYILQSKFEYCGRKKASVIIYTFWNK